MRIKEKIKDKLKLLWGRGRSNFHGNTTDHTINKIVEVFVDEEGNKIANGKATLALVCLQCKIVFYIGKESHSVLKNLNLMFESY